MRVRGATWRDQSGGCGSAIDSRNPGHGFEAIARLGQRDGWSGKRERIMRGLGPLGKGSKYGCNWKGRDGIARIPLALAGSICNAMPMRWGAPHQS